ncbi:unnamed protein product [Zymoseptoria tritici ST99CH_1A5]|nr:unnamed protein product [Zymoseptoria tritici ST99CH_1E4]SMR63335.1 unnamed protein product [Zymoseptoria tritici ST99CH_3D1]SMY28676.1 unnamed protein product [Zymoseptoria tritici ST99CH_1A5]
MLFATLTLLVAALAPSVAGQAPKGAKISAKDHHDYGDQKDGWHWWDKEHFWKPVVCSTTADCKKQALKGQNQYKNCPFPATKDKNYFDFDVDLQYGGTACLPVPKQKQKECYCGAGLSGDPAKLKQWVNAYFAADGLKNVSVNKCCIFGKPEDKNFAWNCTLQCGKGNKKCIQEVGADSCKKGDKKCIQKVGSAPFAFIPINQAPACPK